MTAFSIASSLRKFFARKLTYVADMRRDTKSPDLLHLFAARRVMPDDGDSYDIWHHCVLNGATFEMHFGQNQRGNDFSIKSPFASRALVAMSAQLNLPLAFNLAEETSPFPFVEREVGESDTAEIEPLPAQGIVLTSRKLGDRERYRVDFRRNNQTIASHLLPGDCTYLRHSVYMPHLRRLVTTYRRENSLGGGGIAIFALDSENGALLYDDYVV